MSGGCFISGGEIMDEKVFQVPAGVSQIKTMSNMIRISFDTQENISAESLKRIFEWRNKIGWLLFAVRQIETDDLDLPAIKSDSKKSPSERMRAVLFRIWEQDNGGHEVFENFYVWYMEKMIDKLKSRLT
jgi:hypothetical protein